MAATIGNWLSGRAWWIAACVVLAALSLLLPSTLTYDPQTWALWGREIAHLKLNTHAGPAWKPLPVLVDTLTAPLGGAERWIWLVIARAGGILAVVMAYRLARRLAGAGAGLFAAVGLVLSASFLDYLTPLGMSEPLLAGLALLAVERHLDGRYPHAAALIYACVLLRPELLPFFVVYGAFLWTRNVRSRGWLIAGVVVVPLALFLPDYLGSGDWMRSSKRAAVPSQGGALLSGHPGLAALQNGVRPVMVPVIVGAVVAAVWSTVTWVRRREEGTVVAVCVLSAACFLEEAVLTQLRKSSGEGRYMIIGYGFGCVLGGIGCDRLARTVGGLWTARPWAALRLGTVAVVLGTAPFVWNELDNLAKNAGEVPNQSHKYAELAAAITLAGGRERVLSCGPLLSDTYQIPAIAWDLRIHISQIVVVLPPGATRRDLVAPDATVAAPGSTTAGTMFRTRTTRHSPLLPILPSASRFHLIAVTPQWQILSTC